MRLIVTKRSSDYHVRLEGHPEIWDCGRTVLEALGNWLLTHRGVVGVEIVEEV